jgi:hypothetical protein
MAKHPKKNSQELVSNFRERCRKLEEATAAPPTDAEIPALISAMAERPLQDNEVQRLRKAGTKAAALLQNALLTTSFFSIAMKKEVPRWK